MTDVTPIMFKWLLVTPDTRAYKPSAPQLEPVSVFVAVDVPMIDKYISNTEALSLPDVSQAIITPDGMRYCIDQLEASMQVAQVEYTEDEFGTDSWEEDKETTTTKETKAEDDFDSWEDEEVSDTVSDSSDEWEDAPSDAVEEDEAIDWSEEDFE